MELIHDGLLVINALPINVAQKYRDGQMYLEQKKMKILKKKLGHANRRTNTDMTKSKITKIQAINQQNTKQKTKT